MLPVETFHPGTPVYGKRGGLCRCKDEAFVSNGKGSIKFYQKENRE
jgi:hypothetical protein